MVDLDWKSKRVVSPDMPGKSPKRSNKPLHVVIPAPYRGGSADIAAASSLACSAYEYYLRLPELRKLWTCSEFTGWKSESLIRPSLQALELTFRFVSTVLSDSRPYANQREWTRRLESLARSQVELVAAFVERDEGEAESSGAAPIGGDSVSSVGTGFLDRDGSCAEVWRLPGESSSAGIATVVSRTSDGSLLPRLVEWRKSEDVAQKIIYTVECAMRRCPYTLGIGEPNLAAKPSINYDQVVNPHALHALRRNPYDDQIQNRENQTLYTIHQILETWIHVANELLNRIVEEIESKRFEIAASDCYLLEMVWKLLTEIEDLHLLMDPEDFLRLKRQLDIRSEKAPFCFRSTALVELTRRCRDLKHNVPEILGVEVDPMGGPRIQEAAMRLYGEKTEFEKIHLLQAMQAIEAALKRFFYAYRQVLVVMMGSLEARGNCAMAGGGSEGDDSLSQVFLEPTYFPSLDAAKTFLADSLSHAARAAP